MKITTYLTTLITQALTDLTLPVPATIHLEHPADPTHGDYASNVAMVSIGQLAQLPVGDATPQYKNPRQLAEAIKESIQHQLEASSEPSLVTTVTVAGPGFINFHLSEHFLMAEMGRVIEKRGEIVEQVNEGKKAIVEYSSPNIAKPFTIGHLRSTIIGDAVANLMSAVGWTVYKDNHLGDWGTQFGKQIYAIKTWGDEAALDNSSQPVKDLVALYVKFHEEAEKNPALEDEGRAWFKKLEAGDEEARRLWHKCIEWSWKEFKRIYKLLDVNFTENEGKGYGESFFEDKMAPVIAELEAKGLIKESEGAKLIFFPNEQYPPLMVMKKDGATLYATRDLATDYFRLHHYGHDILIVNEVGGEQALYFQQLFAAEQLAGWYQPGQRIHVKHGMYRFKDGKMSTRKGNVIWLEDVLQEAFNRVQAQAKTPLDEQSLWKIAVGAVKWNDLRRESAKDIAFDFDEITNIQGNSGPYLQYTYVRAQSVLSKAEKAINIDKDSLFNNVMQLGESYELAPTEKDILRNIYIYSEIVEKAADEYAPHHLATYLFNLAQTYNTFYNHEIILPKDITTDQVTNQVYFRLALTQAVSMILQHGLGLLGIQTVDQM
ncbi:MAG TPA: arginine--tRNA ligase [Vitreimonas sp.]|nr:arginine--tRNA ligase [Vitreimonas sp.]